MTQQQRPHRSKTTISARSTSIAHDLRNTLSCIRGYAQLLLAGSDEQLKVKALSTIEAAASRCCELLVRMLHPGTSAAELARRIDGALSSNGCYAVDSPVSGSPVRAKDATLSLMVGGSPAAYRKALPWLKMLGTPTHMGPPGSGQITKSINQIIMGSTREHE